MKARSLIAGASYDPPTLKVIGQAFDEAWAEIAHLHSASPLRTQAARLKLANYLLESANTFGHDVEAMKRAALKKMQAP